MTDILRVLATVPLPIGDVLSLEGGGARLEATIIGYRERDIIMLAPLFAPGERQNFGEGDEVTAKFLADGVPMGFSSRILSRHEEPVPLVAIEYPDRFRSLSVRKSERVKTFLPGALTSSEGITRPGVLLNISEGGGLMALEDRTWEPDEQFELALTLPENRLIAGLPCALRHKDKDDDNFLIGFEVLDQGRPEYASFLDYYKMVSGSFTVPKDIQTIYPV